jgi:hypothetical protein
VSRVHEWGAPSRRRTPDRECELVLLSDDELSNANVDVVNRSDILEFVDGATIHPA